MKAKKQEEREEEEGKKRVAMTVSRALGSKRQKQA